MLGLLCAAVIAFQDSTPRPVPANVTADTGTANLVARARAHRDRAERLVTSYQAAVNQRIGVGIRALRRDRMLFHQQLTARITWRRDSTSTIEMTGARQAIPVAIAGVHIPQALTEQASILAFDPSEDYVRLLGDDPEGMLYPLADSAERHYAYAPGDTTYITLPTGREIRLIELKVTARRPSFHYLTGSLWFDADSWGLVRMVVRPSRAFDLELDGDSGDADDVPGVLKPVRVSVDYITFEYGLYDQRWWLPRFMAVDGEFSMGSFLRAPVRFERVYEISQVTGGGEPPPRSPARWRAGAKGPNIDSLFAADSTRLSEDSLGVFRAACAVADSLEQDSLKQRRRDGGVNVEVRRGFRDCLRGRVLEASGHASHSDVAVVIPADTMALLTSVELGAPILDMGDVISEGELRQLGDAIGALPEAQRPLRRLRTAGLRYNRVEGLSGAIAGGLPVGPLQLRASARLGIADLEPNGELALGNPGRAIEWRLAAYRRLVSVDPPTQGLGFGNSVNALLFGRDDGDYYRTLGVELAGQPGPSRSRWIEWRLFAERQRAAAKETDVSLLRLFDSARRFRPTITAAAIDQAGASVTLRGYHAYGVASGLGAELFVEGQAGDSALARSALTLRGTVPFAGLVAGFEAAAGATVGDLPPQGLWYLGGPQTLRGYSGNAMNGATFWRGRLEVANNFPAARLSLFSDAGWAGPRSGFGASRPLISAGLGASFLDGLVRVDLSRGLRRPGGGWRCDVYADGLL